MSNQMTRKPPRDWALGATVHYLVLVFVAPTRCRMYVPRTPSGVVGGLVESSQCCGTATGRSRRVQGILFLKFRWLKHTKTF